MKWIFSALLMFMFCGNSLLAQQHPPVKTGSWHFTHPVYAQLRLVPSSVNLKVGFKVNEWTGLQEPYRDFQVEFKVPITTTPPPPWPPNAPKDYSTRWYHYDLDVIISPKFVKRGGGTGDTIPVCDSPVEPKFVLIKLLVTPPTPELDKIYQIATVSSSKDKYTWDVFVRFVDEKPDYAADARRRAAALESGTTPQQ